MKKINNNFGGLVITIDTKTGVDFNKKMENN